MDQITYGGDDQNQSYSLLPQYRLNGKAVQKGFGKAKDIAMETTVRLLRNGKLIALGGIIHGDGYILTKASSCIGAREAETVDGKKYPLRIKKRYEENDLAIYQLISDDASFPVFNWKSENNVTEGSWVLQHIRHLKRLEWALRVEIPEKLNVEGGVMGVLLVDENSKSQGVKISEVVPQAAAYRAGLIKDDIITHADGRRVKNKESLIKIVGKKDPGDVVRIKLTRNEEIKDFLITLGHRSVTFDLFNRNLQMSGPVSKRKDNFTMVLQHDLPLAKEAMGGPFST